MTSRLQRWGERALGRAHVVEPRIASRFEQPAAMTAGFVVQEADVDMTRAETVSRRAAAAQRASSQPIDEAPPPAVPSEPPAPSARIVRAREPLPPASPMPRSSRVARQEHAEPPAPAHAVVIEPLPRQTERAGAVRPAPAPDDPSTDAPSREPRSNAPSLEAAIAKLQAWMERDDQAERTDVAEPVREPERSHARPVTNDVSPRAPSEQRAVATERASRVPPIAPAPAAPAPPPARVEVHIDTIVVRAASPRAASPRAHPAAGLASFLARRTAGRL